MLNRNVTLHGGWEQAKIKTEGLHEKICQLTLQYPHLVSILRWQLGQTEVVLHALPERNAIQAKKLLY